MNKCRLKSAKIENTGLIFACPLKKKVNACCFNKIRNLNLKNRSKVYFGLNELEFENLIELHKQCLYNSNLS